MALTDLNARLDATLSLIATDGTTEAADVYDAGQLKASLGIGSKLYARMGVTIQGAGAGTVQFQVFSCDAADFGGKVVLNSSRIYDTNTELLVSSMGTGITKGTVIFLEIPAIPRNLVPDANKFIGVQAVMVGATSAGSVTVDIVNGIDSIDTFYDAV